MSEAADQPVADTPAPGVEADAPEIDAKAAEDIEGDGEEPEEGQPDDDTEEIEHDGQKYKIPKALKPALLMQADYTKKTQEVAELRRTVEARQAEIQQQAEAQATTLQERATLTAVDAQLEQYQAIDWAQYAAQHGTDAAVVAQGQWRQLEAAKSQLQGEITRKETEFRSQRELTTASALREADQVLAREVRGYGPDLIKAVSETASTFGFSPLELRDSLVGADGKPDVRAIKVLAELSELRAFKAKHETKTKQAQTAEKVAAVQPAKTVGARASGYKPGLNDDLPKDEWFRRRNAQIAAQRKADGR
jgi:hypothetical protein